MQLARLCRYGVPGSAAHLFEAAFKQALPGKFEKQPDLLFHLVTMLSPKLLHQHGVPVYRALQVSWSSERQE